MERAGAGQARPVLRTPSHRQKPVRCAGISGLSPLIAGWRSPDPTGTAADEPDGRIDAAFFDRMSADWRRDQERCLRDIEQHQPADQSYLEEGVQLLELARKREVEATALGQFTSDGHFRKTPQKPGKSNVIANRHI